MNIIVFQPDAKNYTILEHNQENLDMLAQYQKEAFGKPLPKEFWIKVRQMWVEHNIPYTIWPDEKISCSTSATSEQEKLADKLYYEVMKEYSPTVAKVQLLEWTKTTSQITCQDTNLIHFL